ncbi:MAG: NADPH-dependent F420 reductase, partial [Porticoccaceae bacterium]
MSDELPVLAILGGTGELGTGLARRWLQAGYAVIIGSRTKEKAEAAVEELQKVLAERGVQSLNVSAMDNIAAAGAADIVAMTVPFAHHRSTLETVKEQLQGKILIDVTVPLVPPKVARVQLPEEGSAGQIAQNILGENVS